MQQSKKSDSVCHFVCPQVDLIRSIGESAALGTAGCVLWGSSYDFNDKVVLHMSSLFIVTHKMAG